jgi:hypothetical protein
MEKTKEIIEKANSFASIKEAKEYLKSFQEFEIIELGDLFGYFSEYNILYSEKENEHFRIYYEK